MLENMEDYTNNGIVYAEDPGDGSWFEIIGSNGELKQGTKR